MNLKDRMKNGMLFYEHGHKDPIDIQQEPLYFPVPRDGIWSYSCLDWYVYRLDGTWNCIHDTVP